MAASVARVVSQVQRWTCSPTAGDVSDAVLLERFAQGRDESAFAALVVRYGGMVLRLCRRILGDAHTAEDAFQATFVILARKAGTIKHPDALPGWLHGVARRVALKARTKSAGHSLAHIPRQEALLDPHPDPLTQLSARELLDLLDAGVRQLPAPQRSAVVLCCLEGHTQEEAARRLGVTAGSLKGHLERGRRRLQGRLARRGIALSAALALVAISRSVAASAPLQQSAVRAALDRAGGQVAALAESVLRRMYAVKLTSVALLMVTLTLAASTTVALSYRGTTEQTPPDKTPDAALAARATEARRPEAQTDTFGDPLPDGAIARLGTVRFRHGLPITFLAFTADGKRLVSHGGDGVRVWDSKNGKQLAYYAPDGPDFGNAIDLSPDGKVVAVAPGGQSKPLELRDADSGRLLGALPSKNSLRVRFSPDGKRLAVAANYPGGVELWDIATQKQVRAWRADSPQFVEHLVFSADGRRLLTADSDKRLRLWDVETGRQLRGFPYQREPGVLSPDGKFVAVLEANEKREPSPGVAEWVAAISLWDATTGKRVRKLTRTAQSDAPFSSLTFTADGKRLITAGPDQFLRVWDPATGEELRRLPFTVGLPNVLALSRDGDTLAAVVYGGRAIRLVDMRSGQERTPLLGHQAYVNAAALSPDGRTAITNSTEGSLLVWDATTGQLRRRLEGGQDYIQSLRFAADGRTLLSSGEEGKPLYAWDLLTGKGRRQIEADIRAKHIEKVVVSSDGKSVVCLDSDRTVRLFDAVSGEQQRCFSIQMPAQLLGLALTPGARSLVAWSNDRKVRVWDVTDGRPLHDYPLPLNKESIPPGETHVVSFYNATLSPDGRLLAVGSQHNHAWAVDEQGKVVQGAKPEHYLILLDLATGCIAGRFDKVSSDASTLAFSPDGRLLAWGGYGDPTPHVVEVASGRERYRFLGHQGFVTALTFSAEGRRLLSGSSDTTALIWDLTGRAHQPPVPTATEVEMLWKHLGSEDAARAAQAIRQLAAAPDAAVPLLRRRLRPAPVVDEGHLARLMTDLESDSFANRQKALAELEKLGDQALPAYRKTLEGKPPLEMRRHLEHLLEKAGPAWWDVSGERLRALRAVEALELAGTKEAREVLKTLAAGAPGARLTEEAKAALIRLAGNRR
jgi:RNA polymerase sigma factor (sigma-70 family)